MFSAWVSFLKVEDRNRSIMGMLFSQVYCMANKTIYWPVDFLPYMHMHKWAVVCVWHNRKECVRILVCYDNQLPNILDDVPKSDFFELGQYFLIDLETRTLVAIK